MNSNRSKRSSKCPLRQRHSPGIALVSTLWLLMLLSGLALTASYVVRVQALLTRRSFDLARVQGAADAAVVNTISEASDEQPSRRPPFGTSRNFDFDGVAVTVVVTKESGRIDLNTAPDELLKAFLQSQGLTADAASTLVDELRARRRLTVPDELRQLPGWRTRQLQCWLNSLTTYSGRPDIDLANAAPGALAGLRWLKEHDLQNTLNAPDSPVPSLGGGVSVSGEVLRIRASASSAEVSATTEWIGWITGDPLRPALTMRWDHHGRGTESCASSP